MSQSLADTVWCATLVRNAKDEDKYVGPIPEAPHWKIMPPSVFVAT